MAEYFGKFGLGPMVNGSGRDDFDLIFINEFLQGPPAAIGVSLAPPAMRVVQQIIRFNKGTGRNHPVGGVFEALVKPTKQRQRREVSPTQTFKAFFQLSFGQVLPDLNGV